MRHMVWVELHKLAKATPVRTALGLLLGFICFAYWQTGQNVQRGLWSPDLLAPQWSLSYTLALLATVGPIFIGVIGAWCCGQEFRFRTWPELVTHGASRMKIWLAKVLAVCLAVLATLLMALAVGYGSSLLMAGRLALIQVDTTTMRQFGAVLFQSIFWALVALTCSVALRGTGAGALAVLALPLVETIFWSSELRRWLPIWNQRAVNGALFGTQPLGMVSFFSHPDYPPLGQAIALLVVLLLLLVAGSQWMLRRAPWL